MSDDRTGERDRMVERHLVARGIRDARVLAAMRAVPREAFIAGELAEFAYEDAPLPIESAQTISQPYIVALMTAALELEPHQHVLEVGTGSGYAAAVLSHLAAEVYTIERHEELAAAAERRLHELGYRNVRVRHGDGTLGWAEHAPFDAIVVAAGGPDVPEALLAQLAVGGRLVIPIGPTPRDLYSLYSSIDAVLRYLDDVDPDAARVARTRYGCLTPWQGDPAAYGRAVVTQGYRGCEERVVAILTDLFDKRLAYQHRDGERFLDALQNARVVANAERYYRAMYYGSRESWNLRDQHMFETLQLVLAFRGPATKAVVWEHNSHVGNAAATEMGARGELNVGELARETYGEAAYAIGFGTDHGTVAAATDWDGPMEVKQVRPAHAESYERICHEAAVEAFLLPLRHARRADVRDELTPPRLERAIGVIYRPETELASHYFQAVLPAQFDEWIWFDETRAVTPLGHVESRGAPETYPFGL